MWGNVRALTLILAAASLPFSATASATETIDLSGLNGKSRIDAIKVITDLKLKYDVRFVQQCALEDTVVLVTPDSAEEGTVIAIYVNSKKNIIVPEDVIGMDNAEAVARFKALGANVVEGTRMDPRDFEGNFCGTYREFVISKEVTSTLPKPGLCLDDSKTITLFRTKTGTDFQSQRYPNGECR